MSRIQNPALLQEFKKSDGITYPPVTGNNGTNYFGWGGSNFASPKWFGSLSAVNGNTGAQNEG